MIKLNLEYSGIDEKELRKYDDYDFLSELKEKYPKNIGWLNLPNYSNEFLEKINNTAKEINENYDILVVVGIGGSYLGPKCAIDMLAQKENVLFAGTSFDPVEIDKIIKKCKNKRVALNIISKSGSTLETLVAFEILKDNLNITNSKSIYITTTENNAFDKYCLDKGYRTFYIPADVGGRYSVLSPVGLLPLAVAGIDIFTIIKGAYDEKEDILTNKQNACKDYAIARYIYETKIKKPVEVFATFKSSLHSLLDWHKQLYMESLGKNGKGVFVACAKYSSDLHSVGQFFQEGTQEIFETILTCKKSNVDFKLKGIENFNQAMVNNKSLSKINEIVEISTILAHIKNDVKILQIEFDEINAYNLGALFFFFELSCAINGILSNVNPFDQNGVEEYKSNMRRLLNENKI